MEIQVVEEAGLVSALRGMRFSFQKECDIKDIEYSFKDFETYESYMNTAKKLCTKDLGHSKFLRCIGVWALIRAPRYWWPEMDQYKVGSTTLSKSTVHTLTKRPVTVDDFEGDIDGLDDGVVDVINFYIEQGDLLSAKKLLPESYLQTRLWFGNYAVIRNIIKQRKVHRLKAEWDYFIDEMYKQLNNPELLGVDNDTTKSN